MRDDTDIEKEAKEKITGIFLSEILNAMGVVPSGKIFTRAAKFIEAESDATLRDKMHEQVAAIKELYMRRTEN